MFERKSGQPLLTFSVYDVRRIPKFAIFHQGIYFIWLRRISLLLVDIILVTLAWVFAEFLGTPTDSFWDVTTSTIALVPILGVAISLIAIHKLYKAGRFRRSYLSIWQAMSWTAILLLFINYFYGADRFVSRSHFLLFWFFGCLFICLGRFVIDWLTHSLRIRGLLRYPAVIIADGNDRDRAIEVVKNEHRYQVMDVMNGSSLDLSQRDDTLTRIKNLGVMEVFVAWNAIRNRMFLGQRFQALGISLVILPFDLERLFGGAHIQMFSQDLPCVNFSPPVIAGMDFWVKRLFDFSASIIALILLSPVYLAIALAIKLDSPGAVFYKQTRIGLHSKPFKVWKFRSMAQNAAELQHQLEQMNQTKDGVLFKIKDDPRITRVGKFIRRYSLDELPQIFNVLLGEMSLVGPRPLPLRDVEKFEDRYFIRQDVLPGITGMWQVSGRSDIDNFEDVLKLDLFYIQNWSLLLDISIIFKTFAAVIRKSGAY